MKSSLCFVLFAGSSGGFFVYWSSSLVGNEKHEKITLLMAHKSGGHLDSE